ncbi:hypothetical protein [Paraburkholderia caffeinilytica]|uniref:hypothetical protein n=1 Tax=Paraburkholderia caffeinilytica TaxID=1761016 RepID=UPI003DA1AC4C
MPLEPPLLLPALAAPLPLPPLCRAQPPTLVVVQSRGLNTRAASSAAVGSSGAVPVATAPAAELSSCASCVTLCALLAGNAASA